MTHPADRAVDLAEQAIAPHREPMRFALAHLQPLEALALLGYLVAATIDRFPPEHRADMLAAFCDELLVDTDA